MSSEYMRNLLESIEKANTITEGYDDRVQQVADKINSEYKDGITKRELPAAIKKHGGNQVEMRGSERARKDFMKDVEAKVNKRRDTSRQDAKRERVNIALEKIARWIQDGVSNSFPDGDPFDYVAPRARKIGVPMDNLIDWLDRAAKKHLDAKDYHDYLDQIWADYAIGNMGTDPGDDYMKPNPFTGKTPPSPEERWG